MSNTTTKASVHRVGQRSHSCGDHDGFWVTPYDAFYFSSLQTHLQLLQVAID